MPSLHISSPPHPFHLRGLFGDLNDAEEGERITEADLASRRIRRVARRTSDESNASSGSSTSIQEEDEDEDEEDYGRAYRDDLHRQAAGFGLLALSTSAPTRFSAFGGSFHSAEQQQQQPQQQLQQHNVSATRVSLHSLLTESREPRSAVSASLPSLQSIITRDPAGSLSPPHASFSHLALRSPSTDPMDFDAARIYHRPSDDRLPTPPDSATPTTFSSPATTATSALSASLNGGNGTRKVPSAEFTIENLLAPSEPPSPMDAARSPPILPSLINLSSWPRPHTDSRQTSSYPYQLPHPYTDPIHSPQNSSSPPAPSTLISPGSLQTSQYEPHPTTLPRSRRRAVSFNHATTSRPSHFHNHAPPSSRSLLAIHLPGGARTTAWSPTDGDPSAMSPVSASAVSPSHPYAFVDEHGRKRSRDWLGGLQALPGPAMAAPQLSKPLNWVVTSKDDFTDASQSNRKRRRIPDTTRALLEREFLSYPIPTADQRASLAAVTGMSSRSIQVWFQNRRQKCRLERRRISWPGPGPVVGAAGEVLVKGGGVGQVVAVGVEEKTTSRRASDGAMGG
ncbi:hypothetical protein HK101_011275 [Irineochytrium annulatum]|nr:hypothetical protein HK101_011275 [Irineochytrium annulatum]